MSMEHELYKITQKVADFITGMGENGDAEFNSLALEVFEFQYHSIEPYRKLCQRRGRTPETVQQWGEIPAVPADAFKHFSLFAGRPESVVKTFKSSGTTDPSRASKSHFSASGLELMNAAIQVNAARMLFPDRRPTRVFILAPSPEQAPAMIMAHGMAQLMKLFGDEGSRFFVGPEGLETDSLIAELKQCQGQAIPATLLGASFGFVHLFDAMAAQGLRLNLPQGSRLMDAGGYKGRSREVEKEAFVDWACELLGLRPENLVNLLGLTEMASQIYDGVLRRHFLTHHPRGQNRDAAPITRVKEPPHWTRTVLVDPRQMKGGEPQPISEMGRPGLLRHLDLANVERPMVIQSEDIGVYRRLCPKNSGDEGGSFGFEILRRVRSAEPRGCSLSMEEFEEVSR